MTERKIRSLCLYCGSHFGDDSAFAQTVAEVGRILAQRNIHVVFGGGRVGLMGVLADAVLAAGGTVTGVTTTQLAKAEIAHTGLTELHVVSTMHERKAMMEQLADGFVALPGGPGTFEEILEQWTWAQLGIHSKPCGILDVDGYFMPLQKMVAAMEAQEFVTHEHVEILKVSRDFSTLLDMFDAYTPPHVRWPTKRG